MENVMSVFNKQGETMRVSFLGKGGSGKTTLSTSFIKFLENKDEKVLAIDADINVHLGQSLNMETKYLGDDFEEISKYLEIIK